MGGRDPESENGDPEKYFGLWTQEPAHRAHGLAYSATPQGDFISKLIFSYGHTRYIQH